MAIALSELVSDVAVAIKAVDAGSPQGRSKTRTYQPGFGPLSEREAVARVAAQPDIPEKEANVIWYCLGSGRSKLSSFGRLETMAEKLSTGLKTYCIPMQAMSALLETVSNWINLNSAREKPSWFSYMSTLLRG